MRCDRILWLPDVEQMVRVARALELENRHQDREDQQDKDAEGQHSGTVESWAVDLWGNGGEGHHAEGQGSVDDGHYLSFDAKLGLLARGEVLSGALLGHSDVGSVSNGVVHVASVEEEDGHDYGDAPNGFGGEHEQHLVKVLFDGEHHGEGDNGGGDDVAPRKRDVDHDGLARTLANDLGELERKVGLWDGQWLPALDAPGLASGRLVDEHLRHGLELELLEHLHVAVGKVSFGKEQAVAVRVVLGPGVDEHLELWRQRHAHGAPDLRVRGGQQHHQPVVSWARNHLLQVPLGQLDAVAAARSLQPLQPSSRHRLAHHRQRQHAAPNTYSHCAFLLRVIYNFT